MRTRIIILGAVAAMLAGCTASKKAARSVAEEPVRQERQKEEKIVLYPEGHPLYQRQVMQAADPGAIEQAATLTYRRPRKDRPAMIFPVSQTQHVRIAGVNPLPEGGVLELDLDAMAEDFCYPYQGNPISRYGPRGNSFHTGLDLKAIPNDTIRAAFPGVVRMSKDYSGYGNIVVIKHYNGFETVYSHGSKNLVKVNDAVEPGDPIALAGRTGQATTEHLHFEVRAGDTHIDPERLLDTDARTLRKGKLYLTMLNGQLIAYADRTQLEAIEKQQSERLLAQAQPVKPEIDIRKDVQAQAPGEAVYYSIKSGDTLSAIARRYGTTVSKLCQLNNIKSTSILRLNQRLRVK